MTAGVTGAWSWWTHPRAQLIGNTVHLGAADPDDAFAATINLHNGSVEKWPVAPSNGNDHNSPALLARPGKPALVAYAGHAADPMIRIRRGLQPADESLGPFADEQKHDAPEDLATYAILHDVGDTVHLWFRCRATYWGYMRSDDWGLTWSERTLVFQGDDKLYCAIRQTPEGALVAMTTHPHWNGTQDIHVAEVNYTTGAVTTNDHSAGTLNGEVIAIGNLDVVASPAEGYRTWVYDAVGRSEPAILWASMDPSDMAATGRYHITRRVGGQWVTEDLAATGKPFLNGANMYAGGAQFATDGAVLLSRHDGNRWLLERHDGPEATALAESSEAGDPVRAWPVEDSNGKIAVNLLRRYDNYDDFDAGIALIST